MFNVYLIDKLFEALFNVYLTNEDMKILSNDAKTAQGYEETHLLVFNIRHKTIGNGNGKRRITTSAYENKCHPNDSKIMKALMVRCSEDGSNDFAFIPYGLTQMIANETYRRQIVLHNNFLAAMAVVPIHIISKTMIKEKVEEKQQNFFRNQID